jgi:hypothetical protein
MGRHRLATTVIVAAVAPTLLMSEALSAPAERVQRGEASWSSPVRVAGVDPRSDASVSSPLVSLAPEGDITVVWRRDGRVLSRTRQAGQAWGPVLSVGTGSPEDLDVDADGDVTVVWEHFLRRDRSVLLASRRPDGGRWSRPHRLSRVPRLRDQFLGVGGVLDVNPRGDAVVAWTYGNPEHSNLQNRVEVSIRRSGGTWSPRTRLGRLDTVADEAVMSSGGVPTVLVNHDGRLRAFRRPSGGWRPVGGPASRRASDAVLTLGGRGSRVLATWATEGRPPSVRGSWLTADGWSPTRRLTRQVNGWAHAAGVDRSGMATVAWESPRGTIQAIRWMRGQAPGAPRTLARRDAANVAVTVAGDGTATVAWAGRVPGTRFDYRARAVRRPPTGPWSGTTTVSRRRNIGLEESLALESWPGGRAALAWTNENFTSIWLARS